MHSEGILSGELKHGPLAMIDKDMPCIMLITKDNTYKVHPCTLIVCATPAISPTPHPLSQKCSNKYTVEYGTSN